VKRGTRPQRITRVAGKLGERYRRRVDAGVVQVKRRPLARRGRRPRFHALYAYDLETTRIKAGTPRPLYITAYGADWQCSAPVRNILELRDILIARFLVPERAGARFVAWNGNNFDVYLIASALLHSDDYVLRPYLTRTKSLRGLRVEERKNAPGKRRPLAWEFLDGIAMLGLTGRKLSWFLDTFAPDYAKLAAPSWDVEEFDARNPAHVKYAERDSEGLYHAMVRAQQIVVDNFGYPLAPTIGNLGIKIFQLRMPEGVAVWSPPHRIVSVIKREVMRGGYCFCVRRYRGPVWKFDLNQAYAAAMREAWLPCGSGAYVGQWMGRDTPALYCITARKPGNRVPFYWRDSTGLAQFALDRVGPTWVTSIELAQLRRERWRVEIHEGYKWDSAFKMKRYVGELERLRIGAPGGPNGAQGVIMKAIGNNSYGKTVEETSGLELVMANEAPEGFFEYQDATDDLKHLWYRIAPPVIRDYHQPQIGAFITSHVRMVVRRAAVLDPASWLYADTDCVMFSKPIALPTDASIYGKWKIEAEGEQYILIDKKVYASADGKTRHAKGLNIDRVTIENFREWFDGQPPTQTQVQRVNFTKVMTGAEMFAERTKIGSRRVA
jgi:hypothetical protein